MARHCHGSVTVLLRFIPFSLVAVNLTMRSGAYSGQLVIRFGVTEGTSEISYLSQFQLLNATGSV